MHSWATTNCSTRQHGVATAGLAAGRSRYRRADRERPGTGQSPRPGPRPRYRTDPSGSSLPDPDLPRYEPPGSDPSPRDRSEPLTPRSERRDRTEPPGTGPSPPDRPRRRPGPAHRAAPRSPPPPPPPGCRHTGAAVRARTGSAPHTPRSPPVPAHRSPPGTALSTASSTVRPPGPIGAPGSAGKPRDPPETTGNYRARPRRHRGAAMSEVPGRGAGPGGGAGLSQWERGAWFEGHKGAWFAHNRRGSI